MPTVSPVRHRAPIFLLFVFSAALAVVLTVAASARAAAPITSFYAGPIAKDSTCSPTGKAPYTDEPAVPSRQVDGLASSADANIA